MAVDNDTLGAALGILAGMPDTAASSAAAAAASAAEAREAAESIDSATVEETLAYMDIGGSAEPSDVVAVTGATPVIKAAKNTMYVCTAKAVTRLTLTPPASGLCVVRFASGSTATELTVPAAVRFPEWFDRTALESGRVYEISIMDGVYGTVVSWA